MKSVMRFGGNFELPSTFLVGVIEGEELAVFFMDNPEGHKAALAWATRPPLDPDFSAARKLFQMSVTFRREVTVQPPTPATLVIKDSAQEGIGWLTGR